MFDLDEDFGGSSDLFWDNDAADLGSFECFETLFVLRERDMPFERILKIRDAFDPNGTVADDGAAGKFREFLNSLFHVFRSPGGGLLKYGSYADTDRPCLKKLKISRSLQGQKYNKNKRALQNEFYMKGFNFDI
jgi:hypothetical protein